MKKLIFKDTEIEGFDFEIVGNNVWELDEQGEKTCLRIGGFSNIDDIVIEQI